MKSIYRCLVMVICVAALSGCKVGYFHAETTLSSDGSVERAILQPKSKTPDAAREPVSWEKTGFTAEKSFDDFAGDIRKLPLADDGNDYFAAWTKVASANDLPEHFAKLSGDESFTSRFERQFERRDLGLLIEFVWEETLTDVVTLDEFRKARVEGIELFVRLLETTLNQALDEEYDTTKLMDWIRNEGAAFAMDATDLVYDFARAKARSLPDNSHDDVRTRQFVTLCEEYGFIGLFDESGSLQQEAVLKLAESIIQKTVERRDGKPLDAELIRDLLDASGWSGNDGQSPVAERLKGEWKRAIEAQPGGSEAVEKQAKNLVARIQGVHGVSTEKFRFMMTFPGVVVQTNGVLVSDDRVSWQFSGSDAWPAGFSMTGRSLLDESGKIDELKKWRETVHRETLLRVRDLVSKDQQLTEVLKKCRATGNLTPLRELADSSDDGDTVDRSRRLLTLLVPVDDN